MTNTWLIFLVAFLAQNASPASAGFFSRLTGQETENEEQVAAGIGGRDEMTWTVENGVVYAPLRNNSRIPLVGFGVGGLKREVVASRVAEAIQDDKKTRLIDTSQVSGNEALVAEGILQGAQRMNEKVEVHIVTKIWYTHLGYQRTKLSVEESLTAFQPLLESDQVDVRLHFLLNWPHCYDEVHYMNCDNDEANLPEHVKSAGPDPTKDRSGAWKDSWRALEDYYRSGEYPIESIGVSNFHVHHLEEMESFARVQPHVLQANLWSLIYDHHLVEYCHKRNIHVQAFNVLRGTLLRPEVAPHAFHHIQNVAIGLSGQGESAYTPAQVVLAWLVQHGVSVVPSTSSMDRLAENSASAVSGIPVLSDGQIETLAHAVEAYLSGKDMPADIPVKVTFHASTKDMVVYWVHPSAEIRLAVVRKGEYYNETSYPGHAYRMYDAQNKDAYVDHVVSPHIGYHETVHVDLSSKGVRSDTESLVIGQQQGGSENGTNIFGWLGSMLQQK